MKAKGPDTSTLTQVSNPGCQLQVQGTQDGFIVTVQSRTTAYDLATPETTIHLARDQAELFVLLRRLCFLVKKRTVSTTYAAP